MSDLKELRDDVKEIRKDMVHVKETLVRNTVSLEHHVARTDLAEARIGKLEKYLLMIVVMMAAAGASQEFHVFDFLKALLGL